MSTTRLRILEEHGLTLAPREEQALFWRRYNTRRRPASRIGEFADRIVAAQPEAAGPLDEIRRAWQAILPEEFSAQSRVRGLSRGKLLVDVASGAARYVMSRQLTGKLVEALNEALESPQIRRIEYRVGRIGPDRRRKADSKED